MNRRNFLKCAGAVLLASQLPNVGETSLAPPNPHGDSWDYYPLDTSTQIVPSTFVRRVLFVQEGGTATVPPAGTIVSSSDGRYAFTVCEDKGVGAVVPYVTSSWDERMHGKPRGQEFGGVVVMVQAVAPGREYARCNIRRVVTSTIKYDHVCEAHLDRCYVPDEPFCLHFYAHDAMYPPEPVPFPPVCSGNAAYSAS